jgi:hypothetical protein
MEHSLVSGGSGFEDLRRNNRFYVDKMLFIKEALDISLASDAMLFARPRVFGKTMALSALQCFLEGARGKTLSKSRMKLFKGLKIMEAGVDYTE